MALEVREAMRAHRAGMPIAFPARRPLPHVRTAVCVFSDFPPDQSAATTIYFVQDERGPVKVGHASDLRSRLRGETTCEECERADRYREAGKVAPAETAPHTCPDGLRSRGAWAELRRVSAGGAR